MDERSPHDRVGGSADRGAPRGTLPDRELVDLAYISALDAMTPDEYASTERRLGSSDLITRRSFHTVVRGVHEAMAVASDATRTDAPPELRGRILDAIEHTRQDPPVVAAPVVDLGERRARRWRRVAVAAAAVITIGTGVAVVSTSNPRIPDPDVVQIAGPDAQTVIADVTGGGTATVSFSRSQDRAAVTFSDIAAPPPGRVYEMWLVDGVSRSVGVIDTGGNVVRTVSGMGTATTFAVTIEPAGGSPLPTTAPVAQATLNF